MKLVPLRKYVPLKQTVVELVMKSHALYEPQLFTAVFVTRHEVRIKFRNMATGIFRITLRRVLQHFWEWSKIIQNRQQTALLYVMY